MAIRTPLPTREQRDRIVELDSVGWAPEAIARELNITCYRTLQVLGRCWYAPEQQLGSRYFAGRVRDWPRQIGFRYCPCCKLAKALSEWAPLAPNGAACTQCSTKRTLAYVETHREHINALADAWRRENPDTVREVLARYWASEKGKARKSMLRNLKDSDPEKYARRLASSREYYRRLKTDPEKYAEYLAKSAKRYRLRKANPKAS